MYNKTMLRTRASPRSPRPWTSAGSRRQGQRSGDGKYGLSFRGGQERGISLPWLVNWLYEGGDWYPADADSIAIFDTDAARVALEQLVKMYDYAPEGIDSYAYQEAMKAMQQGYAAMFVDAATLAVNLLDPAQTELYDQFGFAALDGTYSWGDGWAFSIGSRTPHADWCWELIKCATSYETALGQIMNRKAISCYRPDVYANDEIYQVLPEDLGAAVEKSASMAKIVYWPLVAQKGEIATEMVQVFYDVIKGNRTVEDGLAHSGRYDRDPGARRRGVQEGCVTPTKSVRRAGQKPRAPDKRICPGERLETCSEIHRARGGPAPTGSCTGC